MSKETEEFRRPAEDANDDEEWGEPVETEVAKPVGTVLSVRFDGETVARLREAAAATGRPTSRVVRDAVSAYLSDASHGEPAPTISVSTAAGHVTYYAGSTQQIRQTRGVDIEIDPRVLEPA